MIRYTTPTLPLRMKADLSGTDIYVTFKMCDKIILEKKNPEITVEEGTTQILIPLSQEETALFPADKTVSIMVNAISPAGDRVATGTAVIKALANHIERVIRYGD